jgi:hypothetical protein
MYNTTVEHYPFQKGFMFGMYWENQDMGDSVGFFVMLEANRFQSTFVEIGKSISIKTI